MQDLERSSPGLENWHQLCSPRGPAETKGPKDPAALLCRMPVGSRFNHVHARAPSFSSRVDQARRKPPSPQSPTKDRFAMIPSYCVINGVAQLADLALPEVRCSFGEQHYGRRKGWKEIPEANSKVSGPQPQYCSWSQPPNPLVLRGYELLLPGSFCSCWLLCRELPWGTMAAATE